jgi:hypothetical protein
MSAASCLFCRTSCCNPALWPALSAAQSHFLGRKLLMEWLGVSAIDWELVVRILIQCALFSMSAFFSGSETALFSLSRIDLQKLRNSRNPHSESIHAMLDEPRRLIVRCSAATNS